MQGFERALRRPIETSPTDGVNCTHSSYVANRLYAFELIIINNAYFTQCRLSNIPQGD